EKAHVKFIEDLLIPNIVALIAAGHIANDREPFIGNHQSKLQLLEMWLMIFAKSTDNLNVLVLIRFCYGLGIIVTVDREGSSVRMYTADIHVLNSCSLACDSTQ